MRLDRSVLCVWACSIVACGGPRSFRDVPLQGDAPIDEQIDAVAPVDRTTMDVIQVDADGPTPDASDAFDGSTATWDVPIAPCDVPDTDSVSPALPFGGELTFPFHSEHCVAYTSNPPRLRYTAFAANELGVWLGGAGELYGRWTPPYAVHQPRHAHDWLLSPFPNLPERDERARLVVGRRFAAITADGRQLFYRDETSDWHELTGFAAFEMAYAEGDDLFVFRSGHGPQRFDGATWTDMPLGPVGLVDAVTGSRDDLFVSSGSTVFHFDGTAWTQLPGTRAGPLARTSRNHLLASHGTAFWDGASWHDVEPPSYAGCPRSLSADLEIVSVGADVLVSESCYPASDRHSALWRWDPSREQYSLVATAPFAIDAATVDADGVVHALGSTTDPLVLNPWRYSCSAWIPEFTSLAGDRQPRSFAGAGSDRFMSSDEGVLRLDATGSAAIGMPSQPVGALWESYDGTLFVAFDDDPIAPSHIVVGRYRDGTWTQDATLPSARLYVLYGVSSTDVSLGTLTGHIYRWNGSRWADAGFSPPSACNISRLARGSGETHFVQCDSRFTIDAYQWIPGSTPVHHMDTIAPSFNASQPFAYGSFNEPSTGIRRLGTNDGSGWVALGAEPEPIAGGLGGTGPDNAMLGANGALARYDRIRGWSVIEDAVTHLIRGDLAWTDGRFAAIADDGGAVICDFGP